MNIINNVAGKAIAVVTFLVSSLCVYAAEVTYRIVEFNKTTDDFTIAASGMVPRIRGSTSKTSLVQLRATATTRYHATTRLRCILKVGKGVVLRE